MVAFIGTKSIFLPLCNKKSKKYLQLHPPYTIFAYETSAYNGHSMGNVAFSSDICCALYNGHSIVIKLFPF